MAQVTAGETITLNINGQTLTAKVEDASKSDRISVKVEATQSPDYNVGQVYEFDRSKIEVS